MREYDVVSQYTGEILYESPLFYECDKFIRNNALSGFATVYQCVTDRPRTPICTMDRWLHWADTSMYVLNLA